METKNNQMAQALSDEALEGVAGGASLTSEWLDQHTLPLFKQGYTADDVFWALVDDKLIDEYEQYYVSDLKMKLGDYLNARMDEYMAH